MATVTLEIADSDVERIAAAVVRRLSAQAPKTTTDQHVTVSEAARQLHQSARGVRRLISLGRLQASRVGPGARGRVLVSLESIRALLAEGLR